MICQDPEEERAAAVAVAADLAEAHAVAVVSTEEDIAAAVFMAADSTEDRTADFTVDSMADFTEVRVITEVAVVALADF